MKTIDDNIKEICEETGLDVGQVKANIEDWALAIMMRGVIVKTEIKRWRAKIAMGEDDLFFSADYEEKDEDWDSFKDNYIDFGRRLIIPKRIDDRLNSIEKSARRNLSTNSFETVWGQFVPCTVFEEWKTKNDLLKKTFFEAREEICSNWDAIREEILDEYSCFSKVLYKRNKIKIEYSKFESMILSKVNSYFVTSDTFARSFVFDDFFYYIPVPTQVEGEIYKTKKIYNEVDKINKEIEMREFVQQETMKKRSEQIEAFMNETVMRIREMMFSIIGDIKSAIALDRSCVSSHKTRTSLLKMIEKVRKVDFFSDEEVRNAIDKLQIDIEKNSKDRCDDEIIKSLEELESITKSSISNIGLGRSRLLEQ